MQTLKKAQEEFYLQTHQTNSISLMLDENQKEIDDMILEEITSSLLNLESNHESK